VESRIYNAVVAGGFVGDSVRPWGLQALCTKRLEAIAGVSFVKALRRQVCLARSVADRLLPKRRLP
jgi:hypothetical protein